MAKDSKRVGMVGRKGFARNPLNILVCYPHMFAQRALLLKGDEGWFRAESSRVQEKFKLWLSLMQLTVKYHKLSRMPTESGFDQG